ncbi:hypothetical protein EIN_226620 [Entamoeba invadens IP1]|uniref:Alpha-type protein kinase domain-containing protein n=1 Tax=Entamoeba invadens IP1 TaxID=370355 RepID=A0A0A1U2M1_ENTIV|nr:hypothetical protein EIN_226620 [Entamoeba invadens IP1]ELP88279.1 hypothetical protein EIN_226620 [Entamoeba invadens IP1]|eukprot:XP_004255050.1 hypothetical protein EIN_226620 [Entamoeba invadens IP1]
MKSQQNVRLDEITKMSDRISTIGRFGEIVNFETLIPLDVTSDLVIICDGYFPQFSSMIEALPDIVQITLVYFSTRIFKTNALGKEDALKTFTPDFFQNTEKPTAMTNTFQTQQDNISLAKVLLLFTNRIKMNIKSLKKNVLLVLTKNRNFTHELPDTFVTSILPLLRPPEVFLSILLTKPHLYKQVAYIHEKLGAKVVAGISTLPPRKIPKDKGERIEKKGFRIDIPTDYWETHPFGCENTPTHFVVTPVSIAVYKKCSRYGENDRLAEYDCFFDKKTGVLLSENEEAMEEKDTMFSEMEQRGLVCYLVWLFNEESKKFGGKPIHVGQRSIFVEDFTCSIFREEEWMYPKSEVFKRIKGYKRMYLEERISTTKVLSDISQSLTLECFKHFSQKASQDQLIVDLKTVGVIESEGHSEYQIEECSVLHTSLFKFMLVNRNFERTKTTAFSEHTCNVNCERIKLGEEDELESSKKNRAITAV